MESARTIEQAFTGKIRDSESGNDYFGARHYSSSTGRVAQVLAFETSDSDTV